MNIRAVEESEARFEAYVQALTSVIGHQDRALPLRDYCKGLLVDTDRKSVYGCGDCAGEDRAAASIPSAFRGQCAIVRRRCFAKSAGLDLAGRGKAWLHRSLDP